MSFLHCFLQRSFWFTLILLLSCAFAETETIEIESVEAWQYMLALSEEVMPYLYSESEDGFSCNLSATEAKRALEELAFEWQMHPSGIAESVAAHFWNDWTVIHIEGYEVAEVIREDVDSKEIGMLLEAMYEQHAPCLLSVMRVLVDGYEGYYVKQSDGRYLRLARARGEPYRVLALSTDYFPGTGVFEPLGIVYGVRLAALLQIDWIRKPAIDAITLSISKRIEATGNPLKIFE